MVSPKFTTLPDVVHEVQGHLDLGNCYVPAPPGLGPATLPLQLARSRRRQNGTLPSLAK